MPSSLLTDPFRLWREGVNKLEGDLNALANSGMNSPQFAGVLHRYVRALLGMQQMLEKVLHMTLVKLDLPSRSEIAELTTSLQRIEAKLDRLLPAEAVAPAGPRPARTRRPPEEAGAAPAARPMTEPSPRPAARRARSTAARTPAEPARKPARARR
jgi:hypothetical protein